jgi:hypothetical protein
MGYRFNPPPGWPPAPEGFTPPPDWRPDPAWPPAPPGWQLWLDDGAGMPAAPPAMPRTRPRNVRRRRIRRGLIWLTAALAIAVVGIVYDASTSAQRSSTGQITKNGNLSITSLHAGDCFQNPANATSGTDIAQVTAVSCATPHDAQVIALLPVSASNYPDAAAFKSQAQTGCKAALGADVDRSQLTSTMSLNYFYPDQTSWVDGQRSISCVIAASSADLTSSLLK